MQDLWWNFATQNLTPTLSKREGAYFWQAKIG